MAPVVRTALWMKTARIRTVLIVEDDEPIADMLESAFNDELGYDASHVGSGEKALSEIARATPDLVLLDIQLPGMSGLELYDLLKADDRFKDLPVVFQTAGGRANADALRERGIATYVRKPFDLEELIRFVKILVPPFKGNAKKCAPPAPPAP